MEAADFCRKKEQGKKMKKMMEKNTVEERKGNLTEEDQKKEICDAEKQQEKTEETYTPEESWIEANEDWMKGG